MKITTKSCINIFIATSVAHFSAIPSAFADELSFPSVWSVIAEKSPAQKAMKEQIDAFQIAKDRADLHWLPHVFAGASQYTTNDPSASFFGLLQQHNVTQQDFNPSTLNSPGQNSFLTETIGLDLPLYEGGMKVAGVKMQAHLLASAGQESARVTNEQYAEVAKSYASMAVLKEQQSKLIELQQTAERLKKSYKLGDKSNAVGYSGLLGLKSMGNRLSGLVRQYQAQFDAYRLALNEMRMETSQNWEPQKIVAIKFVSQYLATAYPVGTKSYTQEAIEEKAMAAKEGSEIERARHLPRVGAFAELSNFQGARQTNGSWTAGLYLKWSLFDVGDYGKAREARIQAASAEHYAEAVGQRDRAESQGLIQASEAMKSNIQLIQDSEQIMIEQTKVTESLFHSGSINALQFVEVLSRRADLVVSQTDVQLAYVKAAADLIQKNHFVIPINNGGTK